MLVKTRFISVVGLCAWRRKTLVLADPQALVIANAAKEAYDYLGSPEGELALAQACVYLATAPKSNALYKAFKGAMRAAKENTASAKTYIKCANETYEAGRLWQLSL